MSNFISKVQLTDNVVAEIKDANAQTSITNINSKIGTMSDLQTTDKTSLVNSINEVVASVDSEAQARQNADATLQQNVANEVQARQDADATLQQNIANEVQARQNADSAINSKIGNLSNLATNDKTNVVSAINEVVNLPKGVILNVKEYGAVGDGVTNDYAAIVATMNAANTKGLSIIYFPDGEYNCGNGQFTLDTSKYMFWGGANAEIISSGLTGSAAFITLTSPLSLDQYSFNRCPIKQLSIKGNYFTDTTATGVIGVKMGTDTTFVAPHCVLENVNIINFAVGLEMSSGYKTVYINCSFIANNRGINVPAAGVQQAVPCTFIGCYWECNNYAIFGGAYGYNNFSIFGGAFEYNRSVFTTVMKMSFFGTRFEFDCKASCDASLNVRAIFNGASSSGGRTIIKFTNCYFLGLDNFASNVGHWIANPYKASAYNTSPFYLFGGGGKISCEFYQCEFEDSNQPSGVYYISTDKYAGSGNYTHSLTNMIDPNSVVTGSNGFVN